MAMQLIECVPNFSEGRNKNVIDAIVNTFRNRKGCVLLDSRADKDHNRLVVSLAGEPQAVQDALIDAAKVAISNIDMEQHSGGHPRIGAIDVVPFVPLRNMDMQSCVNLAHHFGRSGYSIACVRGSVPKCRYWRRLRRAHVPNNGSSSVTLRFLLLLCFSSNRIE